MKIQQLVAQVVRGEHLTAAQAQQCFEALMDGALEPEVIAALLTALAAKGETAAELVGAVTALRSHAQPVRLPAAAEAIDTCGTGGDGKPIFNISTAVAVVAAAAGATVAKHGNRSNVRPSGSAEVLAELGVNVDADVAVVERCLAECRIAFLYAVRLHPAMRHAAGVRRALGFRTIFNLVGPLANPAGVRRQLIGVSRPEHVELILQALRDLGAERAMVVHGEDGLCDLSIGAASRLGRWDGEVATFETVEPAVVGAEVSGLDDLRVMCAADSATLIRRVLAGETGPARDIVVFNAAAALWVAGVVSGWEEGAFRARLVLDSGDAARVLSRWVVVSHETGGGDGDSSPARK